MKITLRRITTLSVVFAILASTACSSGGGGGSTDGTAPGDSFSSGGGSSERQAIDNFVNDVVLDIYSRLDAESQTLLDAVLIFILEPSDANLLAARAAWVRTRVPWEESETALFGPVDFRGFDPALDTWPVNRTDLEAVLSSGADLSSANVANFDPSVKGFHTIEYLLFGDGGSQTAGGFDDRRFQ